MAKLEFIDITQDIDISRFRCEKSRINTYLKREAYYEHIACFSNTKLVKINDKLVAFYTTEIRILEIPIDCDDNLYPVICLKYLAVDEKHENKGIGSIIIKILLDDIEPLKNVTGLRCLYIDAITDKIQWYRNRGFELINENDAHSSSVTVPMFIDFRNNELVYDLLDE